MKEGGKSDGSSSQRSVNKSHSINRKAYNLKFISVCGGDHRDEADVLTTTAQHFLDRPVANIERLAGTRRICIGSGRNFQHIVAHAFGMLSATYSPSRNLLNAVDLLMPSSPTLGLRFLRGKTIRKRKGMGS